MCSWANRVNAENNRKENHGTNMLVNLGCFLIASVTNIYLLFHYWKTTDWYYKECIVANFYEIISKSPADDAIYAIAFGFVPVTVLFACMVLSGRL